MFKKCVLFRNCDYFFHCLQINEFYILLSTLNLVFLNKIFFFFLFQRVHPFMVDKIKCKSNQRRPAVIYIDLSAERCPEIVRAKRGYRKYYKMVYYKFSIKYI